MVNIDCILYIEWSLAACIVPVQVFIQMNSFLALIKNNYVYNALSGVDYGYLLFVFWKGKLLNCIALFETVLALMFYMTILELICPVCL